MSPRRTAARPVVAWCWSSGLIEVGACMPANLADGSGAIEIARGPSKALQERMCVLARHGKGASAGKLLVPGVPEAGNKLAAAMALRTWLTWCHQAKNNGAVVFSGVAA